MHPGCSGALYQVRCCSGALYQVSMGGCSARDSPTAIEDRIGNVEAPLVAPPPSRPGPAGSPGMLPACLPALASSCMHARACRLCLGAYLHYHKPCQSKDRTTTAVAARCYIREALPMHS